MVEGWLAAEGLAVLGLTAVVGSVTRLSWRVLYTSGVRAAGRQGRGGGAGHDGIVDGPAGQEGAGRAAAEGRGGRQAEATAIQGAVAATAVPPVPPPCLLCQLAMVVLVALSAPRLAWLIGRASDLVPPACALLHCSEKVPKLRIVSFDPLTGHKSVVLPVREAVLEAVGGEFGPLLEPWRRSELARCLVGYVVLRPLAKPASSEPAHAASQKREIALPWSGDPEAALLKVRQADRHPRQQAGAKQQQRS